MLRTLTATLLVISVCAQGHVLAAEKSAGKATKPQLQPDTLPRVYLGPKNKAAFPAWLAGMKQMRAIEQRKIRAKLAKKPLAFKPVYEELDLDFLLLPQTKIMVHDRCFYDPEKQKYTVHKCLDDFEQRYGGVGRVLLWPAYPNMGVDSRNQFDMLRDLPGGINGLREAISQFHKRGVKVCLPFNPWDNGTRSEKEPMEESMANAMIASGADCIFADTMIGPERKFYTSVLAKGKVVSIEPELGFEDDDNEEFVTEEDKSKMEALNWAPASWSYVASGVTGKYPFIPGVERFKWIETRHTPCITLRQELDHLDSLHFAFFNGSCFNAWENIFGTWNGLTQRDAEAIRRVASIYKALPRYFRSPEWEPHSPTLQQGVFASKFPLPEGTVTTLVNRDKKADKKGPQLSVAFSGQKFFDIWNGEELRPHVKNGVATLSFEIEAGGFGSVFEVPANAEKDPALRALLAKMNGLSRSRLSSYSAKWNMMKMELVPIERTAAPKATPPGMVKVPANPNFSFHATGMLVEQYEGAGVQFPWENTPDSEHSHELAIPAFYVDKNLVTNADYKKFLDSSGYAPGDSQNFLRHWKNKTLAPGDEKRPVTWVGIEDARAYCAAAGKRLPNDWEWQYAAQGNDKRSFPWGNKWDARLAPQQDISRSPRPVDPVGKFPKAASPLGMEDVTGFVWQWTNEFRDAGNRRALLRGGTHYCPQGSKWYFPQSLEPSNPGKGCSANKVNEHGTYLLMAPSLDRSGGIGFRCVMDAE